MFARTCRTVEARVFGFFETLGLGLVVRKQSESRRAVRPAWSFFEEGKGAGLNGEADPGSTARLLETAMDCSVLVRRGPDFFFCFRLFGFWQTCWGRRLADGRAGLLDARAEDDAAGGWLPLTTARSTCSRGTSIAPAALYPFESADSLPRFHGFSKASWALRRPSIDQRRRTRLENWKSVIMLVPDRRSAKGPSRFLLLAPFRPTCPQHSRGLGWRRGTRWPRLAGSPLPQLLPVPRGHVVVILSVRRGGLWEQRWPESAVHTEREYPNCIRMTGMTVNRPTASDAMASQIARLPRARARPPFSPTKSRPPGRSSDPPRPVGCFATPLPGTSSPRSAIECRDPCRSTGKRHGWPSSSSHPGSLHGARRKHGQNAGEQPPCRRYREAYHITSHRCPALFAGGLR